MQQSQETIGSLAIIKDKNGNSHGYLGIIISVFKIFSMLESSSEIHTYSENDLKT